MSIDFTPTLDTLILASKKFHTFEFIRRSEEHTSELQSRETISYAVFCLKKKTNNKKKKKNVSNTI